MLSHFRDVNLGSLSPETMLLSISHYCLLRKTKVGTSPPPVPSASYPTSAPCSSVYMALLRLRSLLSSLGQYVMSDSFISPWTVASQAPPSMGFPRQEYWSGLPPPSAGGLPDPGVEPVSPALAGRFLTTELPGKPPGLYSLKINKISLKIVVRRPEGGALPHKSLILFTLSTSQQEETYLVSLAGSHPSLPSPAGKKISPCLATGLPTRDWHNSANKKPL